MDVAGQPSHYPHVQSVDYGVAAGVTEATPAAASAEVTRARAQTRVASPPKPRRGRPAP
jgi:hypothetical protein